MYAFARSCHLSNITIINKTTLIHVATTLNHLGKKCFAFSSLDKSNIPDLLAKL